MKAYNKKNKIASSNNNNDHEDGEEVNEASNFLKIENDISIISEKLTDKVKNSIYQEGSFTFSKNPESFKFPILLKKYENSTYFPFGMEIFHFT